MAAILPFVVRQGAGAGQRLSGAATIIIFPGIRYERMNDPASRKSAKGGTKRDKTKSR